MSRQGGGKEDFGALDIFWKKTMDIAVGSGIITNVERIISLHNIHIGLFSVPAPLFASLQMAGFFRSTRTKLPNMS